MPFSMGKIFKNHIQGFGHWIRVRVRAYLRVPDLHAPYLREIGSCTQPHHSFIPACSSVGFGFPAHSQVFPSSLGDPRLLHVVTGVCSYPQPTPRTQSLDTSTPELAPRTQAPRTPEPRTRVPRIQPTQHPVPRAPNTHYS